MEKPLFVLCALTPGEGAAYSPVQVQKLLFLLDKNIAGQLQARRLDVTEIDEHLENVQGAILHLREYQKILTFPILDFSKHSWTFPANTP